MLQGFRLFCFPSKSISVFSYRYIAKRRVPHEVHGHVAKWFLLASATGVPQGCEAYEYDAIHFQIFISYEGNWQYMKLWLYHHQIVNYIIPLGPNDICSVEGPVDPHPAWAYWRPKSQSSLAAGWWEALLLLQQFRTAWWIGSCCFYISIYIPSISKHFMQLQSTQLTPVWTSGCTLTAQR